LDTQSAIKESGFWSHNDAFLVSAYILQTVKTWHLFNHLQSNAGINANKRAKQCKKINKRAQRALGRSPEEKVKGHSGAYNREPQGHNLNNFDRGPLDDAIYQI